MFVRSVCIYELYNYDIGYVYMIAQCLCLCVVCECAQARGDLPYLALGDHQTYTIPTKPCPTPST